MPNFTIPIRIFTCLFALILVSCDPGYDMKPVGMKEIWSKRFDGFELHVNRISGLIGESWVSLYATINAGSKPVTINSVEMKTSKGIYQGNIYINDGLRNIAAFSGKDLDINWALGNGNSAIDTVGESITVTFNLQVGSENKTAKVKYILQ